jgi:signal transduction histidine kinase
MTATGRGPTDLEWGVARGIAGFRWLAWAWSATVLYLTRADLVRAPLGVALLGLAFAVTAATTEASIRRRTFLFHPAAVLAELAVGLTLLVADGQVYGRGHSQSLGSAWPLAAVLMAGMLGGPVGGTLAGAGLGAGRWLGDVLATYAPTSSLALLSSGVLFTIAGGAAGAAMERVRQAETAVAEARAREDIARELHDGVLQTLAVVQRRSADHELVSLARDQELDLRAFLAGDRPVGGDDDLGQALRRAAARVERRDGLRVEVLLVDEDHPPVAPAVVEAVAGAVGEALTNAAKHGGAARATVFVDVDDEVFCSIKDDGRGFDPATVTEGMGITTSIRARLAELGGTAELDGRPGGGAEVRLRAPLRPKRPST